MARPLHRIIRITALTLLVLAALVVWALYRLIQADGSRPLTAAQLAPRPDACEIAAPDEVDPAPLLAYLQEQALPPVEYVVEKFRSHDVVLLGEAHQIREDYAFIAALLEPLYRRAGVRVLALEVIAQKRAPELRRLLTAPAFDAERVTQILREDYFYWGFGEYLDIFAAVWRFNRSLAPGEAPIEVVGLMPNVNIYHLVCGSWLQKADDIPRLLDVDNEYARPIRQALAHDKKVLVQVGYHHSLVDYRLPKVIHGRMYGEFSRPRLGRLLHEAYGERVFQISRHVRQDHAECYTTPPASPVAALLEDLYVANGCQPIGFDVVNSPFAALRDTSGIYFKYQPAVTLANIAEGYILEAPWTELHCVRWQQGFVTAQTLPELRAYALQQKLVTPAERLTPPEIEQRFSALLASGQRLQ